VSDNIPSPAPTPSAPDSGRVILVTGGGGFLGGAIARQMRERGDTVRSISRGRYPHLAELGIEHVQGDLADPIIAATAVEGVDTIVHVAAKAGVWGPEAEYVAANLTATRNLLAAAQAGGIGRFIYTSSPSVVFAQADQKGIDESTPYPSTYFTHYARTKAEAEQEVLAANGAEMQTVSLRPHLIVGPGDPHLLPRIVQRARAKALPQVGDGTNLADITDVEDAAASHLRADEALQKDGANAACAGKAYFIAQGEPIVLWDWLRDVLGRLDGVPPIRRRIGYRTAFFAGRVLESVYRLLRLPGEPRMTRFVAAQLSKHHTYDISAARRDLGYQPRFSLAEVTERVVADLRERGL